MLSIPSVTDLRKDAKIQVAKNRQAAREEKQKKWEETKKQMLETRATYRKENWDEERQNEYNTWLSNLKADFDIICQSYTQFIIDLSRNALAADKKSFRVWNYTTSDTVQEMVDERGGLKSGVKFPTFFTGFWNKEKRRHNLLEFWEAGIDRLVIPSVAEALKHAGYDVRDISDRNKSFAKVLEVTLGN